LERGCPHPRVRAKLGKIRADEGIRAPAPDRPPTTCGCTVLEPHARLTLVFGCDTVRDVKTISDQQAVRHFEEYSKLAHEGERILVTREGKPWVLLAPPSSPNEVPPAPSAWPDFAARLAKHYPAAVDGPTATELLATEKEDRF